jgi:hypothetical protein
MGDDHTFAVVDEVDVGEDSEPHDVGVRRSVLRNGGRARIEV